jgi:hypothetical protein
MLASSTLLMIFACFIAACGDDDASPEGSADGGCVVRDELWSPQEDFSIVPDQVSSDLSECIPTCTRGAPRRVDNFPSITALPAGSCNPAAKACDLGAYVPCRCDPQDGPVNQYRCRCDGGKWTCVNISPGGSVCDNDCEPDASATDQ